MSLSLIHLLVVLAVLCVPYFSPSIIAFAKHKTNRSAILALNFFLGWTAVGWIVAMVWALKGDVVDNPAK
ncbi:MAG: superinfection immunity protein [Candidatus Acidiferrales bacterium]